MQVVLHWEMHGAAVLADVNRPKFPCRHLNINSWGYNFPRCKPLRDPRTDGVQSSLYKEVRNARNALQGARFLPHIPAFNEKMPRLAAGAH